MIVGVVLDSLWLIWRLAASCRSTSRTRRPARARSRTPCLRSLQLRRLRLPPPKVKANGEPVVPKVKKQS